MKYSNIDYRVVGARIKFLRGDESQADFGKKYDKTYTDIGRIERGEVKPTPDLLFRICTDYRKSMEWLLTGEEEIKHIAETASDYGNRIDTEDLAEQLTFIYNYGDEDDKDRLFGVIGRLYKKVVAKSIAKGGEDVKGS